ncbi:MAG: DEAD/DEAH box helicase [Actinomycetota bacterium]
MSRAELLEILTRAESTVAQVRKLRQAIADEVNTSIENSMLAVLRTTSIDDLRGYFPKGTRVTALKGRYDTAADIYKSHPGALAQLPGIGLVSAQAIHAAAKAKAELERSRVRFRLDPDKRSQQDSRLILRLQTLQTLEPRAAELERIVKSVRSQVDPLVDDASRYDSRIKMFFSGPRKKRAATEAVAKLDRIASGRDVARIKTLSSEIAKAGAARSVPIKAIWEAYERDAAALNALLSQFSSARSDAEAAHGFVGKPIAAAAEAVSLDTSRLKARLRGYQAFGAQYAVSRKRVIIGDEMGLGKTVQALAVAAHLASASNARHFLVVCPASVVVNWSNEVAKHTHLRPYEVVGTIREEQLQEWAAAGGVAIMTYGMATKMQLPTRPDLYIIDEAHYVKNPDARRSRAVRALLNRDDRAVFLTGTPMENRLEEFRNLVSYLQPDVAAKLNVGGVKPGPTAFRRSVAPAYLRRNQVDVLNELPELIEVEDWVYMSAPDSRRYRRAVESGNFMAMRQSTFLSEGESRSAKLERLVEIVEEANDNNLKVDVFSYFIKDIAEVDNTLSARVFVPLTGSVSSAGRQKLIDDFTAYSGPATLLSQIEAGGVGLNIQAASVVIITEPQWKPSTEQQAIARAHRMGQVRTVQVHRLLAKESIDEAMRQLVLGKADLFDSYVRESSVKDANPGAVDSSWSPQKPNQDDLVRAEQRRLGLGAGVQ